MYLKGAPQESFFWALQTQTWAMQIVLFYGDSVAVFKPSTVLLSVFVCNCPEFYSFGCTLFIANWSTSCQLGLKNAMFIHSFIHSFILVMEGSNGMVVN